MKNKMAQHEQYLRTLADLTQVISTHTSGSGDFPTSIDGLGLYRREFPSISVSCIIPPSIVLVVQGAKQMWLGGDPYQYGVSEYLVTSLELPGDSEVLKASEDEPCLGLVFRLDYQLIADLLSYSSLPAGTHPTEEKGVSIGFATVDILEPLLRLVKLLDEPESIPVLAPLIQREIHYRLLLSEQSRRLRQIALVDSLSNRIAKAIDWLKVNYMHSLRIDELAARVQMSTPTFHQRFRQMTTMSPLQYQKSLRLGEARRLMLNENLDVSSAAFRVGYESPSQFSREYSRQFGIAPKKDVMRLRSHGSSD